jgi:cell division protein FtsA
VGTSKVCCFIADIDDRGRPRVVGIGHQVSKGIRNGTVVNMELAETCIANAVHAAEKMAGSQIDSAYLSIAGGNLRSQAVQVDVSIAGHEVGEPDIRRILDNARVRELPPDQELVHFLPIGYAIDRTRGIKDPRGMYGEKLIADIHIVSANHSGLRNLVSCVKRCHLDIDNLVAAPYASGLACLAEDEIDLGVTLIDMGGGTTTITVFFDGYMIYCDSIPVGGHHITNDIARGLSTPITHAERMKTLYGNAIASSIDDREVIDVPQIGEDEREAANHIPRSVLTGIIRPRIEETLELVRSHLEDSGMNRISGRRCVITGGASQLPGIRELATSILDKQVRLGRPQKVSGLAEATQGPAFSACAGMLLYATNEARQGATHRSFASKASSNNIFGRAKKWLKENF